jgi:hypothetical protein
MTLGAPSSRRMMMSVAASRGRTAVLGLEGQSARLSLASSKAFSVIGSTVGAPPRD